MSVWWDKLPALTPVKGLARFLYVVTHWQDISEDLKKRDERLQAVEDAGRLLLKLQHQTHEAEMAAFINHLRGMAKKALDEAQQQTKNMKEFEERARAMFDDYIDTAQALALMLYLEQDPVVRDLILSRVPPKSHEILNMATSRIRQVLEGKQ